MITKSSIVEIQKLVVNSKSWPIKSNSEQYQFSFKYISSTNNGKIFQKKKKTLFWGRFCVKIIFPTISRYVPLQRSPSISMSKIQSRLVMKPKIIPSISTCKNCSINLLNSSNYLWDTPDLRVLWSIRSRPFLTIPTQ